MTQLALSLPGGEDRRTGVIAWERCPGFLGGQCGADYRLMLDGKWTGWIVIHCGHPTAIRPYYVEGPRGEHFQAYRLLEEAKAIALEQSRGN